MNTSFVQVRSDAPIGVHNFPPCIVSITLWKRIHLSRCFRSIMLWIMNYTFYSLEDTFYSLNPLVQAIRYFQKMPNVLKLPKVKRYQNSTKFSTYIAVSRNTVKINTIHYKNKQGWHEVILGLQTKDASTKTNILRKQ